MDDTLVYDGATIPIDPYDKRVLTMDYDTLGHLITGVTIASSSYSITQIRPVPISVSSLTRSGTTATATTASAHGMSTGDYASLTGADQADYNVTASVTVVDTTSFTFTVANSPTTPATGTITMGWGLGKDNASILTASPYSSRYTQVRVLGGGGRALGRLFEVENTIVTDESPTQTKNRRYFVLIEDL